MVLPVLPVLQGEVRVPLGGYGSAAMRTSMPTGGCGCCWTIWRPGWQNIAEKMRILRPMKSTASSAKFHRIWDAKLYNILISLDVFGVVPRMCHGLVL